jgi:hypothetical protein
VSATPRTDSAPDVLSWRVHPARERRGAALFALLVMALTAALCGELMQSLWWILLAFAVPFAALRRFFLPSEYRIDEHGVTARLLWSRQHYPWDDIRRLVCDARGGFLSTRRQGSLLDLFRGMHLVFGDNREAAVGRIRARLDGVVQPDVVRQASRLPQSAATETCGTSQREALA